MKAVDIVIIPPKEIYDLCVEVNSKDPIQRFGRFNIPHISLWMGVIDEKDIDKCLSILKEIAKNFKNLKLKIIKESHKPLQNRGEHYSFEIEKTDRLRELQENIMNKILKNGEKCSISMINPEFEKLEDITCKWVDEYEDMSMHENFYPHISLRCSSVEGVNYPIRFKAQRLALCHLGNLCICSEIIREVRLE